MLREEFLCLLAQLVMALVEASMLKFTRSVNSSSMPGFYINLRCPIGSWMHVDSVTHSRPVGCGGSSTKECQDSVDQPTRYINSVCVGKTMCMISSTSNIGSSLWPSFELVVYYECVNRNRFSLCDSTVKEAVYATPIHLHSPSYPPGRVRRDNCSCTIGGSNITATAYELNFSDGIGVFSVLSDGRLSYPRRVEQYDVVLTSGAELLTLGYYGGRGVAQPAWIHVEDTGIMRVSCSSYPLLIPVPPVTVTTSTSTTTTSTITRPTVAITTISVTTAQSTGTSSTTTKESPVTVTSTTTTPIVDLTTVQSTGTSFTTTMASPVADPADIPGYTIASISGGGIVLLATLIAIIAIVCYKRRQFSKAGQHVKDKSTTADAAQPDNDQDGDYLELVNTPNTYNKLYGQMPTKESTYTDIHVYSEIGTS